MNEKPSKNQKLIDAYNAGPSRSAEELRNQPYVGTASERAFSADMRRFFKMCREAFPPVKGEPIEDVMARFAQPPPTPAGARFRDAQTGEVREWDGAAWVAVLPKVVWYGQYLCWVLRAKPDGFIEVQIPQSQRPAIVLDLGPDEYTSIL